ncbi:MAG: hypothetical protein WDA20_14110 [Desulfuromonadales bacterium]
MMKRVFGVIVVAVLLASPAMAAKYDVEILGSLGDKTFADFIREAGAATAYRALSPAEPQGITGFDIGVAVSAIDIDQDTWDELLGGDAPSYLPIPSIRLRKGLPYNIDVGAFYSQVPSSNIKLMGGEVQVALLEGGIASPALALRGSYSTLQGVDDLDLSTYGADAVLSKGFAMLTPYVGVGVVRIEGDYAGDDPFIKSNLDEHSFTETRYFGGVQMSMALFRLTLDAEYLERPVYSLKVSLGW